MHLCRRFQNFPRVAVKFRLEAERSYTSSEVSAESIKIPKAIKRSPTDVLYALASTVKRDPTAPHYKYHDDPYLIPTSNVTKRTFAMAQEAGRKAAHWIKEEHRELFMHQEAQPPIKDFAPRMVYKEDTKVSVTDLEQLIALAEVNDAILVYNLMQQQNIAVSDNVKQSLLELLAFYNHDEPMPAEYIEERTFNEHRALFEQRQTKQWKDGELAEKLFAEIEPKTVAAYAAIIRGMSKYKQAQRAYNLFQEALDKQMQFDTNTYNSIISAVPQLKETFDERWALCQELLQQMCQQQLKPNLSTLNALLYTISTFGNYKLARSCCLKVLAEFKQLGIEPSLGSYYSVLRIFCRERAPVSHVLVDILRECEGKSFEIQHEFDTRFFTSAMDVCRNYLKDKNIAYKLNDLLHTASNYNLIGDSYREAMYYRHYFALLCHTETLEQLMQIYDNLVPNIYVPEPGIMEALLKNVEINGAAELVPRLWSDLIIFDYAHRDTLIKECLNIMLQNKQISEESPLHAQFAQVAWDIYERITDAAAQTRRQGKVNVTGHMLGQILTLLVRGKKDFEDLLKLFAYIDANQHRIAGTPTEQDLLNFVEACIANKAPSPAMQCLQYAVENNMDAAPLAKRIYTAFTLNEVHLSKIKALLGDDFLKQMK